MEDVKPNYFLLTLKLFFILFYFKCYPTFDLAGILFDLDRSQTNRWMHRLQPILEEVLNQKMVLPMRQLRDVFEFIEHFPEVKEVIIDGFIQILIFPVPFDLYNHTESHRQDKHP